MSQLLKFLKEAGRIDEVVVRSVHAFIAENHVASPTKPTLNERLTLSYEARIEHAKSPVAKKLFETIAAKKSNLCLAADVTSAEKLLNIAEATGPFICLLKTHCDIINDFNQDFVNSLTALAVKHNFLIMEDRKFADIGNTAALQYSSGIFRISEWADLVTVHSLTGQSILKGLKSSLVSSEPRGVFLLAEISSEGNLITKDYTEETSKIAVGKTDADFVAGVVCQSANVFTAPGILQLTPGCKIDTTSDGLGQQYDTPDFVVKEKGADIAVVGRGIIGAKDVQATAQIYRDQLWAAYCERIGHSN